MANLKHLFTVGQPVKCKLEGAVYEGTVTEIYSDHVIVNVPKISEHCWFEEGFNMNCIFPVNTLNNMQLF